MQNSLSGGGPTRTMTIRLPDDEKQAAKAVCRKGETLSSMIRMALTKEVAVRNSIDIGETEA